MKDENDSFQSTSPLASTSPSQGGHAKPATHHARVDDLGHGVGAPARAQDENAGRVPGLDLQAVLAEATVQVPLRGPPQVHAHVLHGVERPVEELEEVLDDQLEVGRLLLLLRRARRRRGRAQAAEP